MTLALENNLAPGTGQPSEPATTDTPPKLGLAVVFTSPEATLAALDQAGALAARLNAEITLVVPQIVPYPLPLTTPPVLIAMNEKKLRILAEQSQVQTTVKVYLCRDRSEMLSSALKPRSLVVLGGRKRWWPTAEERLAKSLRRAGHQVIFTETE